MNPERSAPSAPSFVEALRFWLKLGCISFGGPAGQIALMHRELVERRRWISEGRFLHALNYCMLLPGPEAQQLATYLGWLLHRTAGGLAAGLLFILPALVLLLGLSWGYMQWRHAPWLAGLLYGIKPVVLALVLLAMQRLGQRVLRTAWAWGVALAAFAALAAGVAFPWVVLGAASVGLIAGRWSPATFIAASPHRADSTPRPAALIDDDTPAPAQARFSRRRLARVLVVGFGLGVVLPWGLPAGLLSELAAFFSRAALVTFGGAYAVLPYVHQAAVVEHGWLDAAQMMDGLALGESTPGPLIMVVTFVGFVAGWQDAVLPSLVGAPWVAGLVAGLVATWCTFLPSFVFIFVGAPLVEATRDLPGMAAPLTAISAAVVGVIGVLAVALGRAVLWADGFDPLAPLLALAAGVALWRGWPVPAVLATGGLLGLVFGPV